MKIKEFLADKSKWTQGYYAKDSRGDRASANSKYATCWCVLGAAEVCYPDINKRYFVKKRMNSYCYEKYRNYAHIVNDTVGYEAIMEMVNELDV